MYGAVRQFLITGRSEMAEEMSDGKIRFQSSEGIGEVTDQDIQSAQGKGREKSELII